MKRKWWTAVGTLIVVGATGGADYFANGGTSLEGAGAAAALAIIGSVASYLQHRKEKAEVKSVNERVEEITK